MFKFNVQHDCESAKCEATGERLRMQERVESDQIENFVIHNSLDRFFINTHAFHNAHLLRATLPRDLVAPIPLYPDREVKHHEFATELRQQLETKKRKRAQKDGEDEEDIRPRKAPKKSKRRPKAGGRTPAEPLATGRPRRQIKLTEKAKAAPEPDSEEADSDNDSDSDNSYDVSEGDCSN